VAGYVPSGVEDMPFGLDYLFLSSDTTIRAEPKPLHRCALSISPSGDTPVRPIDRLLHRCGQVGAMALRKVTLAVADVLNLGQLDASDRHDLFETAWLELIELLQLEATADLAPWTFH
jgi:hypothetical protein